MTSPEFDLLIKNVRVVRPYGNVVHEADIAIAAGKVARLAPGIDVTRAKAVYDGRGRLAFPGVVDAHMHSGIYSPLAEDAVSESKAAAMGGVTSSLNYFRTGQYYLNKGGPYKKFYPEVLKTSKGRFHVDYGFHLAPMDGTHIKEIPELIEKFGVSSFKIFMFYGSHGLHAAHDEFEVRHVVALVLADHQELALAVALAMQPVRAVEHEDLETADAVLVDQHRDLVDVHPVHRREVESVVDVEAS